MPDLSHDLPLEAGLFQLAEKRLAWADRRETLLSENIANADTPGWKPVDVPPFATELGDAQRRLVRTDPGHLSAPEGGGMQGDHRVRPQARAPDGNAVSLDTELTRIADTQTTQQFVSSLYKTYLGMFNTALDK